MKRDMDLVREVMLAIERDEAMDGSGWYQFNDPKDLGLEDCSYEQLGHILRLIDQAGFVKASPDRRMPLISGLTWHGHEFLDTVRDPGIWRSTKAQASKVAGVGVELLWEIAKAEAKKALGLP